MDFLPTIKEIADKGATDVFIVPGRPLAYKYKGSFYDFSDERLMPGATDTLVTELYSLANHRSMDTVNACGDDDFSFAIPGVARFRANVYRQRGSLAAVLRLIHFDLPNPEKLHITENIVSQVSKNKGLILVTGAAGCGKSTTLACMIDRINSTRSAHIITLEDPIEYLHAHKKSIVSQRDIFLDTESYPKALRAALRQSPDVILIGELRDTDSMDIAMSAAETGHLVISTLHTLGAANTIDRIVDMFPAEKQTQIRLELSMVLSAVITQQLVKTVSGDLMPVFEVMVCNNAIKNLIREAKTHQIDAVIASSAKDGMQTMDSSLLSLYSQGIISADTAITSSFAPDTMEKRLKTL